MQLAVEEDLEGVVLQVEALLLDLVVGEEVFCVVWSADFLDGRQAGSFASR